MKVQRTILVLQVLFIIENLARLLIEINGIDSVFAGPGFLTVTREENFSWESINNDILNKFDTI